MMTDRVKSQTTKTNRVRADFCGLCLGCGANVSSGLRTLRVKALAWIQASDFRPEYVRQHVTSSPRKLFY